MTPHTRAMVAAATFAYIAKRKVAGIFDHATGRDLQIAAEWRGAQLKGFDGDRAAAFGGTLPEIRDDGDRTFVSFEVDGARVTGYDRASESFYAAQVTDGAVQVYDYKQSAWFTYDVQDADVGSDYHRRAEAGR